MSYEFYKIIHLVSLILVIACFGVTFLSEVPKKWARITGMVASFLLMVAGMGLLARIKVGWPGWVIAKMVIWIAVAVSIPLLSKRLKEKKEVAFFSIIAVFIAAIYLAVLQPF